MCPTETSESLCYQAHSLLCTVWTTCCYLWYRTGYARQVVFSVDGTILHPTLSSAVA